MPVTVRVVGVPVLQQYRRMVTADRVERAGLRLCVRIVNRTIGGQDQDGRAFTPYADPKARSWKARIGRGLSKKTVVDLHDSGQMLADLTVVDVSRNRVAIGFRTSRSATLANIHQKGRGRMPVRRFLGIPPAWIRDFIREVWKGR